MRRIRVSITTIALAAVMSTCCEPKVEQQKDNGPQPRIEKNVSKDGVETVTTIMPK